MGLLLLTQGVKSARHFDLVVPDLPFFVKSGQAKRKHCPQLVRFDRQTFYTQLLELQRVAASYP